MHRAASISTIISRLIRLQPQPKWVVSALKTTTPMAVTIVIMTLLFGMQLGPLALLGAMTAVWGRERSFLSGVVTMSGWTLAITASLAVGVIVAPVDWLALPATVALALVGVVAYNVLPSNGPGPLNLFFACALGAYLGTLGDIGWRVVLLTLLSGLLTTALCQIHLLWNPRGPERRAVQSAEAAVDSYVDAGTALVGSRWRAHRSLHRATVMMHPVARRMPDREARTILLNQLSLLAARLHAHEVRRLRLPVGETVLEPRVRPGHPPLFYLIRRELRQHTLGQLTALRVSVGLALAGLVTSIIGTEHFYWSILTAGVILHSGPNRSASVERALHRSLGTLAGVGVVALLAIWTLPAPVELALVILGVFGMNLFLARHYALAIACVTPMSLMVTNVMSPGLPAGFLIQDRVIVTIIGSTSAVLATMIFSTRGLRSVVRGQLRSTAVTIERLIDQLDRRADRDPAGSRLGRALAFELDTTGATVRRASLDVPGLWDLAECEADLVDLGYDTLVVSRSGHRDTRTLRNRLASIPLPSRGRDSTGEP